MSEPTALATVTIENAAEQLKAKIRSAFVELIPPEQWEQMIRDELKKFMQPTPGSQDRWGSPTPAKPSVFSELCRAQYSELLKEQITAVLRSPDFSGDYLNGQVSKAVKEWLTENSEKLIQATILSLAGQAAQNLIANMTHYRP